MGTPKLAVDDPMRAIIQKVNDGEMLTAREVRAYTRYFVHHEARGCAMVADQAAETYRKAAAGSDESVYSREKCLAAAHGCAGLAEAIRARIPPDDV